MKRTMLLILAIAPLVGKAQGDNFTLNGKINSKTIKAKAYLSYFNAGRSIHDSAEIHHGVFQFKGSVTDPVYAQILISSPGIGPANGIDGLSFFLEKGVIGITSTDSIKNAVISGSKVNADQIKYMAYMENPRKEISEIDREWRAAPESKKSDSTYMNEVKLRYEGYDKEQKALAYKYIEENPDSYFSLMALATIAGRMMDVDKIEPIYNSLSPEVRKSENGQEFAASIVSARTVSVGSIAPEFIQNDANDSPVKLLDFRGKYVLIDFWASWCTLCREQSPNVVKQYQLYKNKNFTILGVSLDLKGKRSDWLAAIKADGLCWTQVWEIKDGNNPVAQLYNIHSLPQNLLIDPSGKIVAKNLMGDALNKQLALLFK